MNIWKLSMRNMKRKTTHSFRCIFAVAISVSVVTILFGIISGMEHDLMHNITHYLAGDLRVHHNDYGKNTLLKTTHSSIENAGTVLEVLRSHPEVEFISQRLIIGGSVFKGNRIEPFIVYGVNINEEQHYQQWDTLDIQGTIPRKGKKEVLLGHKTAKRLNLTIGDKVTLFGTTRHRSSNAMTFIVTGTIRYLVESFSSDFSFIPIETAQRFYKSPDELSEINIRLEKGTSLDTIQTLLTSELKDLERNDLTVLSWREMSIMNMVRLIRIIYLNIAAIFFFLGSLVVFNTVNSLLLERRYEIAVMEAVGFTKKEVHRIIWLEFFIISLLGVIVGMILGNIIVLVLGTQGLDMGFKGMDSEGLMFSTLLYPRISAFWTILVSIYGFVIVNVLIWLPLRKVYKFKMIEALQRGS